MPIVPFIIALLLVGGVSTAVVADDAKPGDRLYKLDQMIERFQEKWTATDSAKAALIANLSEERAKELLSLREIDPSALTNPAKALWEEHHKEAVERLLASIEKLDATIATFKEKLADTDKPGQKAAFEKVIAQLNDIRARREARIKEIEAKVFPGQKNLSINQNLKAWRITAKDEIKEIKEEITDEFKDDDDDETTNSTNSSNNSESKSNEVENETES